MKKFNEYIDEKCMGAYTSDADKKKKRKRKGQTEESSNEKGDRFKNFINK